MNNGQKTPECNMREALVSYLYNEATAEEKASVQAHLNQCSACREELNSFERVRGMLQEWKVDDLPVVRVVAERHSGDRSLPTVFRELLSVTPFWAKALGAAAMAMLILAVIGTDVRVSKDGFSFHTDLLRRGQTAVTGSGTEVPNANIEQVRTEVRGLVNQLIAESERQQRDELKAQLVSLEAQLNNIHSADLSKLLSRIQEQQARLRTIERDIDRREGLDLTDILFSDVSRPGERSSSGGSD